MKLPPPPCAVLAGTVHGHNAPLTSAARRTALQVPHSAALGSLDEGYLRLRNRKQQQLNAMAVQEEAMFADKAPSIAVEPSMLSHVEDALQLRGNLFDQIWKR